MMGVLGVRRGLSPAVPTARSLVPISWVFVSMSSSGVTPRMWHSAASTVRFSRSGVPVTRRWAWEVDKVIPCSARGTMMSVVACMPSRAISSRSRQV